MDILAGIRTIWQRPDAKIWLLFMLAALALHIYLMGKLNIVEDESAYMQDAAQISAHVLPFRDFGGTKGPLWLFIFHGWQLLTGRSLWAARLWPSLAQVASIPLLYGLALRLQWRRRAALIAAALWALAPVVVSLTTNVTHIPLELVCVLAGFYCLRRDDWRYSIPAAVTLFWMALLMRATASAFIPAALVLLWWRPDRARAWWQAGLVLLGWLLATVAIVYPLYGWPKTAFFFNADALLIAGKQAAVTAAGQSQPFWMSLYAALLPLWRDGLSIIMPAILLPLVLVRKKPWQYIWVAITVITVAALAAQFMVMPDKGWQQWPWMVWVAVALVVVLGVFLQPEQKITAAPRTALWFLAAWLLGFFGFYKSWGHSPTPFYPLESVPALALVAGFTLDRIWQWPSQHRILTKVWIAAFLAIMMLDAVITYQTIPLRQYRGTIEVQAAQAMAAIIKDKVPPNAEIFTAQPVFAYLTNHPLYGNYTHPGWYLSERAGYLPAFIRREFYPDLDVLQTRVARDVNWIVVDWRTSDVYFNAGHPEKAAWLTMLHTQFKPVATVSNPASRDITLYERITP
jgi:4-amino-4-deoxy-L-arabinose transferase-like glycosyltransferase